MITLQTDERGEVTGIQGAVCDKCDCDVKDVGALVVIDNRLSESIGPPRFSIVLGDVQRKIVARCRQCILIHGLPEG
jgi:hypothetical protein